MPPRIDLHVDRAGLDLLPGEVGQVRVHISNTGEVVDSFALSVTGPDPCWFTLSESEVRLFPGESSDVLLQVQLPHSNTKPPGSYLFQLSAISRDDSLQSAGIELTVSVAGAGPMGMALGIEPERVRGRRGLYAVTLHNSANFARSTVLEVTDAEEALSYALGTPELRPTPVAEPYRLASVGQPVAERDGRIEYEVEVPPTGFLVVPLLVKPRKRTWTGRDRSLQFGVAAHPPGVEWEPTELQQVSGELIYHPVLAAWAGTRPALWRTLAILLPLLLLACLLIFLLLRPAGDSGPQVAGLTDVGATQTVASRETVEAGTAGGSSTTSQNGGQGAKDAVNAQGTKDAAGDHGGSGASGTVGTATPAEITNGPPVINSFTLAIPPAGAETEVGAALAEPRLAWDVTHADRVRISQTTRSFDLLSMETSKLIDYELVATNTDHLVTNTLSVLLVRPASIEFFVADPTTITAGQSTALRWKARAGIDGSLDGVPVGLGPGGSGGSAVTPAATHTYVLCAGNPAGRVCRSVKVTVVPASQPTFTPLPATSTKAPATATRTPTR
ncbi:MAG: hypothetical protein M3328_05630, partial [Chloroflexota bacterium]|nr:hypothetical protein [Chloroflexota bacterium]